MDSRSGTAVVVSDCRWRRGARNAASAALHAAIKTHRGEPGAVVMILVFKLSLPFIIDGRLFLIVRPEVLFQWKNSTHHCQPTWDVLRFADRDGKNKKH
jgi:hypothetical protein